MRTLSGTLAATDASMAGEEAVGQALALVEQDARENARQQREEEIATDCMELLAKHRARVGRKVWSRVDGHILIQLAALLRGLPGDDQ